MGFAGIAGYEANCSCEECEKRSEMEMRYSESYRRLAGVREGCFINLPERGYGVVFTRPDPTISK
jgi:hypothetical protein